VDDIRRFALETALRYPNVTADEVLGIARDVEAYLREPVPEEDMDAAANVASDYDRQMLGLYIPPGFGAAVAARYATSPVEPKPPSAFDLWPLTPEPDHES